MGVNDGGAGARAGDALRDDRLDRIGNAVLQRAAPGAVQRRLNPDLAHRAASLSFSSTCPSSLDRLLRSSYAAAAIGRSRRHLNNLFGEENKPHANNIRAGVA